MQTAAQQVHEDRKATDAVFVAAFAAILCSGLIVRAVGSTGVELVEKRVLSSAPARPSTLAEWAEYPGAFDRYASDNFGFRSELIALNSYLRYRLGVSASPRVLVGNRGWLFHAGDDNWDFFRGANRLSEAQIKEWLDRMEKRQKWLAERGIRFIILPAPVKSTIYPEYLPYWLRRQAGKTLVDQLASAAAHRPGITFVDPRQRLLERKRDSAVYTPFDTHWNAEGAFIAYSVVMGTIVPAIPGVVPLAWNSVELRPALPENIQRDLVLMLGIDRFLPVQGLEYVPRHAGSIRIQYLTQSTDSNSPQLITTGVKNTSRIMLVRDSYSVAMLPYFEDTFGSLLLTHVQDGPFPQAYMEQYRPDVVLLQVQEAGLGVM